MKRIIFILSMLTILSRPLSSQRSCYAQESLEDHLRQYPGMSVSIAQYLEKINTWIRNFPFHPELHRSAVTIPVVVHVIYKNTGENISDANVQAEITALNTFYRKRNTTEINAVPQAYKALADDAYIQFRLASRDPAGNNTTGITRKSITKAYLTSAGEQPKQLPDGVVAWDPKRYLNIWVCDIRKNDASGDGLLGYSAFPWDTISRFQGVVIDFTCFAPGSVAASFNQGKTVVHEVGHFFGLRHIWGDANCGDDFVADTPTQQTSNTGCPIFPQVTCSNGTNGDMFMNYMDYVDDNCMSIFTSGQRLRMLANIAPGGARASLAVSNALFPTTAVTREYEVFLEPQNAKLPSWKAALVMTHAWACQCSPAIDIMLQQNAGKRGSKYNSMGNEVADAVFALALTPEEMLACYTIDGFYEKLNRGPVTLLSIGASEYYGLVISGMVIDKTNGRALLKIKDPMGIGPRGFFIVNQTGAEYQVDYNEFMTQMLEQAVINNKHIYIVNPPSSI
ncbi:MAG: zinc metalloprotease [Saprospiraceae bacterium]